MSAPRGILVARPGALGDALLAVSALRALRCAFLDEPLTLASHAGAAALLEALGEVDQGVPFDAPGPRWLVAPENGVPEPTPRVVVAWMRGADSLAEAWRGAGVEQVIAGSSRPADGVLVHCARHLLESLAPLGVEQTADERALAILPRVSNEVLMHPGSGSPRKNWPAERFAATARVLGERGVAVRLIVGEADEAAALAVERAFGERLARHEQPALPELAAHLAGCRAYLGNDSGVSHLAGLAGARSVVLFGPTPWEVWRPLGPKVQVAPFDAAPSEVADWLLR